MEVKSGTEHAVRLCVPIISSRKKNGVASSQGIGTAFGGIDRAPFQNEGEITKWQEQILQPPGIRRILFYKIQHIEIVIHEFSLR